MITNNKLRYAELEKIISKSRLSTYNNDISTYIWNSKLSENFFLLLQNLEVGLRNAIYSGYIKHYKDKSFFYLYEQNLKNRYLSKKEFHSRECWKMLCAVKYKLNKQNIEITNDKIISELNFGFWIKILQDKRYTNIWRKIFIDVFPNKNIENNIDETKIEVLNVLDELRKFRNRVFHYEPIFNKTPKIYHTNILESINWISNALCSMSISFDDFDTIFNSQDEIRSKLNKHNLPKISIITVVWNNKETIKDAIDSVLNQTYKDIEYIIIDGASTDGTVDIIKSYRDKISKFVSEPDKGLYDAMNKGIALATGDIVGILNSDDFYIDEFVIEKVVKIFEEKKVDSVYADLVFVKPDDLEKTVRYYDSSKFHPSKFAYGWMPAHPTFFVKREVYEKYGVFRTDLKIAADFDILARFLYTQKISYHYMQEVLVKMRVGGVSTSFSSIWINNIEALRVCRDNGIQTNIFKILSKYPSKIMGLLKR